MFAAGDKFKEYHIHGVLGESSLAATLMAESQANEKVVIKVFKGEVFTSEDGFEHLKRPRKAIADGVLSNRAHLSFYQKAALEESAPGLRQAYLVRGYVEGENLDDWRSRPRSHDEIKAVLRKIYLGLDHLHKGGLIHGGLCPRNIILGGETLKLTDFGAGSTFLGLLLGAGESAGPERQPFLPPWQDKRERLQSPETDIYALAVILYLLQTGTIPEDVPQDAPAPVQKALRGEYPSLGEFWAEVEMAESDTENRSAGGPEEEENPHGDTDEESEVPDDYQGDKEKGEKQKDAMPPPEESAPEAALHVEIAGEGVEREPSGLVYRLEKQIKRQGTLGLYLRNLEKDGKTIRVKAFVVSGSDWIRVEPDEIKLARGEGQFTISLGPIEPPGIFEGKIVLEISSDGDRNRITRDILMRAQSTNGRVNASSWWMWAAASAAAVTLPLLVYFVLTGSESPAPTPTPSLTTTVHSPPAATPTPSPIIPSPLTPSPISPGPLPPTSPSPPPRPPLKAELDRITSGRLTKGEYLLARKELEDLNASAGDDDGIGALLLQLRKALNVSSELTASSGEGAYRSGTRTIASGAGFQLSFTPSDTCYIYIFQVDSLNNLDQLLPNSQALREGNPVEGEKTYRIPSGGNYFVLDNNTGRETIYLVASRWPAEDIEELYAKFKGSSVVQERYRYRRELLERIKSRASAMEAGVSGCFYEEFAFLHTER